MATKYAQQSGDWSNDTSVWYDAESGGNVVSHPVEGDNAIINTGVEVSLNNESGVIVVGDDTGDALTIYGTLKYTSSATNDVTLRLKGKLRGKSGGSLLIGSSSNPITNTKFAFELNYSGSVSNNKYKLYIDSGATFACYGKEKKNWATLTSAVLSGSNSISVDDATGWEVGDRIVLTTTDTLGQSEEFTISAISGTAITLSANTSYDHSSGGYVLNLTKRIEIKSYNYSSGYCSSIESSTGYILNNVSILGNFCRLGGSDYSFNNICFDTVNAEVLKDSNDILSSTFNTITCYKCNNVHFQSFYGCDISDVFYCKRYNATGGGPSSFKIDNTLTRFYACDLAMNEGFSLWRGKIDDIKIWGVSGNYSYFGGDYNCMHLKNVSLCPFGSTSNSRDLYEHNTSRYSKYIFENLTTGSAFGGDLFNEFTLQDEFCIIKNPTYTITRVANLLYGDSSYWSVVGRGGSGKCLVLDPKNSSSYGYCPLQTENMLYVLSNSFLFPVNSGKTITLTLYVKTSVAGFDGDLQIAAEGCGIDYSWTSVSLSGGTTWTQVSHTLGTTTDKGFVRLKIRAKDGAGTSGDIYLDDFAITES